VTKSYVRTEQKKETTWIPRTSLGKMVLEGRIVSIEEVFNQGYKINEAEIVDLCSKSSARSLRR